MNVTGPRQSTQRWLIDEVARDLDLLDVWDLPVEGGRDDFDRLLEMMTTLDPSAAGLPSRILIALRIHLGHLLRLDDKPSDAASLRERVPPSLAGSADDTEMSEVFRVAGLVPLYRTDDEWAGEISNRTVSAALHLGWADQGGGRYRGRLAIYVKPRGVLGTSYMALIQPFRHIVIYPALMRQIERAWAARRPI